MRNVLEHLISNGGLKEGETYYELGQRFGEHPEKIRSAWRRYKAKHGLQSQEVMSSNIEPSSKKEFIIEEDQATFTGTTTDIVTNIDQAIKFSGVDTDVWIPKKQRFSTWTVTMKEKRPFSKSTGLEVSSWNQDNEVYFKQTDITRTNYGCQITFEKRAIAFEDVLKEVRAFVDDNCKTYVSGISIGTGIGTVACADLHLGAKVSELIRTPDFNVGILTQKISRIAEIVNKRNWKEVNFVLNGDYIESFQGLNHPSTFKSLQEGMWGANAVITTNKILCEHLFSKINNLKKVFLVSGNHDRTSIASNVDNTGEVGALLSYMLKLSLPDVEIIYHPLLISHEIDGMNYIITHGNSLLSKQDLTTAVLNWGKQGIYNLMLEGHLHTRIVKRVIKQSKHLVHNVDTVCFDEQRYRKIVLPALFTGNYWSESMGFGGVSGFVTAENNGSGYPIVTDYII